MSGIIFYRTDNLERLREFYINEIGMRLWLEQADCIILKHGNLLLGFCDRGEIEKDGMITFFFETRDEVDVFYKKFKDQADDKPRYNEKYDIYQFFSKDPDGRTLEFQYFESDMNSYWDGAELLERRRSIRKFLDKPLPDETLEELFALLKWSPTSMNRNSCYFVFISDSQIIENLSAVRGKSSAPIGEARMAVAICVDPEATKRVPEDGHIAAYHLLLAAAQLGLGTCWIADMDRANVKEWLDVPAEHYIATVTPLGFPDRREQSRPPEKKIQIRRI